VVLNESRLLFVRETQDASVKRERASRSCACLRGPYGTVRYTNNSVAPGNAQSTRQIQRVFGAISPLDSAPPVFQSL